MARRRKKSTPTDEATRRLLDLMELPESMLTKTELAELDNYVAAQTAAIRASWTPEQEASARGVSFRAGAKQFQSDGRVFQRSAGLTPIDTRDSGIDMDVLMEREQSW